MYSSICLSSDILQGVLKKLTNISMYSKNLSMYSSPKSPPKLNLEKYYVYCTTPNVFLFARVLKYIFEYIGRRGGQKRG